MEDVRNVWAILKVTEWFQAIANGSDPEGGILSDPPGMIMRANCVVDSASSIRLSSNEELPGLTGSVNLVEGPLLLGSGKPPETDIGLFQYGKAVDRIPSGVYCHVGFDPEHYKEIWAQVRSGAFSQCTINLEVGPLPVPNRPLADPVWDVQNNPRLFVLGATVQFVYRSTADLCAQS